MGTALRTHKLVYLLTALLVAFMLGVTVTRVLSGKPMPSEPAGSDEPHPTATLAAAVTATPPSAPRATVAPAPTPTPTPLPTPTPTPTPEPPPPPAGQTEPVPILMYHYIRPDPGPGDPIGRDLSVSPEAFAAQMAWLAEAGFTTLTLGELAAVRANQLALPPKPIVLTFDDGYRDFYEHAWPVLEHHGFKATVFVITGVVDHPPYLTWDMLTALHESGLIEIASHTVTHRELPTLSAAEMEHELRQSKQDLESRLGLPVASFSYPVGRVNDEAVMQVRAAGYDIAVTTRGGYAAADEDALLLPRVRIHGMAPLARFQELLG